MGHPNVLGYGEEKCQIEPVATITNEAEKGPSNMIEHIQSNSAQITALLESLNKANERIRKMEILIGVNR